VPLAFNLAHSGDTALLAVVGAGPVGIDVEGRRDLPELPGLIQMCASATEARALLDLPDGERSRRFLDLWARKEAVLKATGDGLIGGLTAVTVGWTDDGGLVETSDASGQRLWRVLDVPGVAGFSAAVAVPPGDWELCLRSWPGDGLPEG
jgi:4'-phosphopantetheinyl transferase